MDLIIDRSTASQLEVRVHATPDFDCTLRLEAGSSQGLIDFETEVALQKDALFRATVYLEDGMRMILRAKVRGTGDFVRFTCTEHATMLERNMAILDTPGRLFDVTMKRVTAKRDYMGKKKSYFLV